MTISKRIRNACLAHILYSLRQANDDQRVESALLTFHLRLSSALHSMPTEQARQLLAPVVTAFLAELKASVRDRRVMGREGGKNSQSWRTLSKTGLGLIDATAIGLERNVEDTRYHLHLSGFQLRSSRVWTSNERANEVMRGLLVKHLEVVSINVTDVQPVFDFDYETKTVSRMHRMTTTTNQNPMAVSSCLGYALKKGNSLTYPTLSTTRYLLNKQQEALALTEYGTPIQSVEQLIEATAATDGSHQWFECSGGELQLMNSAIHYPNTQYAGYWRALEEVEYKVAVTDKSVQHFTGWGDPVMAAIDRYGTLRRMSEGTYDPMYVDRTGERVRKNPSAIFRALFDFRQAKCCSFLRRDLEEWDLKYFDGLCMQEWLDQMEFEAEMEFEAFWATRMLDTAGAHNGEDH